MNTGSGDESLYIARWTPQAPDKGIALLIGVGDTREFVAAIYNLKAGAISIIDPQDYDWHATDLMIMERSQVINTPMASKVFTVIDEIWLHDTEIMRFIGAHQNH